MRTIERPQFNQLIAGIYSFYRKEFSAFAGNVWWQAMQPYDFEEVVDALNRHCINPDVGQFMPFPADVVRMLQGSSRDAALVAWAKVDRAVRTVGTYRTVVFDDAIIHRVLEDMGGWILLGQKTDKEWPFVANEFSTRYAAFRARSELPSYQKVLLGLIDSHNRQLAMPPQAPILIGDYDKAQRVMNGGVDMPILTMQAAGEQVQLAAAQSGEAKNRPVNLRLVGRTAQDGA